MLALLVPAATIALTKVDYRYLVPVGLGKGGSGRFILDTGTDQSFVTHRGRAHLKAAGAKPGNDGSLRLTAVTVGNLGVGAVAFLPSEKWEGNAIPEGFDGLLGTDVLARFRVGLDLTGSTMRLWPKSVPLERVRQEWSPSGKSADVPLDMSEIGPFVPVRLDDRVLPMCIDTGTAYTVMSMKSAQALGWKGPYTVRKVQWPDRTVTFSFRSIERLGLGGLTLPTPNWVAAYDGPDDTPLLGTNVLEQVSLLLDFPGKRAYFARRQGS